MRLLTLNIIKITTEELFEERSELPSHLFSNYLGEDDYIDIDKIELIHTSVQEEYIKCCEDPVYFAETYCIIKGKRPSKEEINKIREYYKK